MPTPILETHRLIELEQAVTEASKGTPLASSLPEGVNLSDWTVTFDDDFTDIGATVGNNADNKQWCAPGTELSAGAHTHAPLTSANPTENARLVANPIYQQYDASTIALMTRRDAGVKKWSASLTTARYGANADADPFISFAQQYGYFEARFKSPNPSVPVSSSSLLWPAFWLRAINTLGGSTGNLFTPTIEPDIVELYHSDVSGYDTDFGHHMAFHHHEPRKLVAPGYWGRDVHLSSYENMRIEPAISIWGTSGSFAFWDDYHTYGMLITPEEAIVYFDRIEVCRLSLIEEFHQKYFLLLSHQVSQEFADGQPDGINYPMLVDYVRVWQNPDWHAATGTMITRAPIVAGGTANARTFTTALAMASYAAGDGRRFVLQCAAANTGAMTLNANGLGALPVIKMVDGSPVAVSAGDVLDGGWHCFKLDHSNTRFVLTNPGWSMKHPDPWTPIIANKTPLTISVENIEAGLAHKHGVDVALFPVGHAARTNPVVGLTGPRMPVNKTFQVIEGTATGTSLGTVQVINSPSEVVHYVLSGSSSFAVNPSTGEISTVPGAALAVGDVEVEVAAWCIPPVPTIPGANICTVTIEVKADAAFDPGYFELEGNLRLWLDAQDATTLTIAGGTISQMLDKSSNELIFSQATGASQPTYSATGLNSRPAITSVTGPNRLAGSALPLPTSTLENIATRSGNVMSIKLHGVSRLGAAFDYLAAHIGMFVWSPGAVTLWVNDVEVGMAPGTSLTGITTSGCAMWVMDGSSAGGGNLGRIYDSSGMSLLNASTANAGLDAALGEFLVTEGTLAVGVALRNKLFGYAAHHWGLTSLLVADHPYKTTAPRMYA